MRGTSWTVTAVALLLASGCAMTYSPPLAKPVPVVRSFAADRGAVYDAAKVALVRAGYRIGTEDAKLGLLVTPPRQQRLTSAETDCGTTAGLPYIEDNRTVTEVALGVEVRDDEMAVLATITGDYLRGVSVTQSIVLTCVSTGAIEEALIEDIKAGLK